MKRSSHGHSPRLWLAVIKCIWWRMMAQGAANLLEVCGWCVCVCVCVCVCTCMHTHMHVHAAQGYAFVCMWIFACIQIHVDR